MADYKQYNVAFEVVASADGAKDMETVVGWIVESVARMMQPGVESGLHSYHLGSVSITEKPKAGM